MHRNGMVALALAGAFVGCFVGGDPTTLRPGREGPDGGSWSGFGTGEEGPAEGGPPTFGTSAIRPTFGAVTTASVPPPPISGGTLLVSADGSTAIAADPDRDVVYGVDLASQKLVFTTALQAGDEPGRVAEDGAGRVHVALRRGGALVTLDEKTGAVVARRPVCPAPRGVAWDSSNDTVWVACATGELVGLPAAGGAVISRFVVERDLRDVVLAGGAMTVSSFRASKMLRVENGSVARRDALPPEGAFVPRVAWRTAATPNGDLVIVHQMESTLAIPTKQPSGYGGGCQMGEGPAPTPPSNMPIAGDASAACAPEMFQNFSGVPCEEMPGAVVSSLTVLAPDGSVVTSRLFPAALPVDVAVARDGAHFAVAAPGDAFMAKLPTVLVFGPCGDVVPFGVQLPAGAQPIAVAFGAAGELLVQTREPAALWIVDSATQAVKASVALSSVSRDDTGHDVFHTQAGAMISCASCHPEGGDDGHVFSLDGFARRTPSLRGTIAGTAPYHWLGDQASLDALIDDVYTLRMDGALLAQAQKSAVEGWVQAIPAPPAPSWVDAASAARGRAIFESSTAACATCHAGPKLTNDATTDVGTGGSFQVPPLVGVGWRAPLFHDGCAATVADRFGKCSTVGHGDLAGLGAGDLADLTSYLETL